MFCVGMLCMMVFSVVACCVVACSEMVFCVVACCVVALSPTGKLRDVVDTYVSIAKLLQRNL